MPKHRHSHEGQPATGTEFVPYNVPIPVGGEKHHPHEVGLEFAEHSSLPAVVRRTLRRMLRSAVYAALVRLLFGFIKSVLKGGLSRTMLRLVKNEIFSINPLKWGALIGMLSSYRGVQQILERCVPGLGAKGAALIAGAFTSIGYQVMNIETRTELALYTGVRAAHGVLTGNLWPILPAPLKHFKHWDVVTMSLTAMQILYSLFFFPKEHSPSYLKFLQSCVGLPADAFPTTAGFHRSHTVPEMVTMFGQRNLPLPDPKTAHLNALCDCVHYKAGTGCVQNVLHFFSSHLFGFSMKLYLPLKIVTTAIFGRTKAMEEPLETLKKIIVQSLSSSVFLTSYCALPLSVLCLFSNTNFRSPAMIAIVGGAVAGIPTLLEPKSRRMDLALYCALHAVRSAYLHCVTMGWLNRPTRHHITLLSAVATSAMFYQYDFQRDALHRNIVSVVAWLLKERAPRHPKHHEHDGEALQLHEAASKKNGHHIEPRTE